MRYAPRTLTVAFAAGLLATACAAPATWHESKQFATGPTYLDCETVCSQLKGRAVVSIAGKGIAAAPVPIDPSLKVLPICRRISDGRVGYSRQPYYYQTCVVDGKALTGQKFECLCQE